MAGPGEGGTCQGLRDCSYPAAARDIHGPIEDPMSKTQAAIAIEGVALDTIIEGLGLKTTEARASRPGEGLYGTTLPSGWSVVVATGRDHVPTLAWERAVDLSHRQPVLYFAQGHLSMVSGLCSLSTGERAWDLAYDGSRGPSVPTFTGPVPTHTVGFRPMVVGQEAWKLAVDAPAALLAHLMGASVNEQLGRGCKGGWIQLG